MTEKFKETIEFATKTVRNEADGYLMVAYNCEYSSVAVKVDDEPDLLPQVLADAMERYKEMRDLIVESVALYAKKNGNVLEIKTHEDPSLN